MRTDDLVIASLLVTICQGCALWDVEPSGVSQLPPARMARDSVGWQVASLTVKQDQEARLETTLWSELDEEHLPLNVSNQLEANGIRCGISGLNLPGFIRELLDQQEVLSNTTDGIRSFDLTTLNQHQRLQIRRGQRKEIIPSSRRDEVSLLRHHLGNVTGTRYQQAQGILAVRSYPLRDGRVHIELVPEIHHGQPRSRYIGRAGILQQQVRRDFEVFEDLAMHATLSPGETLTLSHTPVAKGLGALLFRETSDGTSDRKLLLIRLAQTQQVHDTESEGTAVPDLEL